MSLLGKLVRRTVKPVIPFWVRARIRALVAQRRQPPPATEVVPLEPGFPDWHTWIERDRRLWRKALSRARRGPEVLIATSMGGFSAGLLVESVLGAALTLRGARVRYLVCDHALPACLQTHVLPPGEHAQTLTEYRLKDLLCGECWNRGSQLLTALGLPIDQYGDLLTEPDRREARRLAADIPADHIADYQWQGMRVGEHAQAGALRFYARGQLADAPLGETTLRRYLEAAVLTGMVMRKLLARRKVDRACFHHGIYVPQGIIAEACRTAGVPLVTWNVAYRKSCFIFSHDDTYHHTMLSEPVSNWERMEFGRQQEQEVMEYLASRLTGSRDWIWFHEKPIEDVAHLTRDLGIDFDKPVIALLTNVFWDAQLHYPANAFKDMLQWVLETIGYFARRSDLQLLIRIHPAEIRGHVPSRQPLLAEIQKVYPHLPANVFVIPPESNTSTYAAMDKCDAVIIYGTKTGVELSSVGIPVIVAGEAWVRGKGITRDANSPREYFDILDSLPWRRRLDDITRHRARKYAYHFFFRRMIPLPFMEPRQGGSAPFGVKLTGLQELLPGRYPGLDVICDGILSRAPFVYPAEQFTTRAAA